jgi:hypothetical protein
MGGTTCLCEKVSMHFMLAITMYVIKLFIYSLQINKQDTLTFLGKWKHRSNSDHQETWWKFG